MAKARPTQRPARRPLTTRDAFRQVRRIHTVPIGEDAECRLREPTIAEVKRMEAAEDNMAAVAEIVAALVIGNDGGPVFKDADEVAETMTLDQVEAVADFVGKLNDPEEAEKN